jgi:hypothetical protein
MVVDFILRIIGEKLYPKSQEDNLRFRYQVIAKCQADPMYAAVIKEQFYRDILFAFNVFFWTYDPRSKMKDLPFITYTFQDEKILEVNRCIEEGEDIFGDKSRDMGLTYIILYTTFWRWLTKQSEEYRLGSRKEDFVDKAGDMDSHFEKLRYLLKRLPAFLLPKGFKENKHSTYARLINPEKSCSFIGEATNKDFGAGGRKNMILFDEFSRWEMAEEAWRSASDATQCKIAISTPLGAANKFAELSRTSEVKNKFHLMWYLHPKKSHTSKKYFEKIKDELGNQDLADKYNSKFSDWERALVGEGLFVDKTGKLRSEWYDKECLKRAKEDVAENLDCDYLSTGQPVFDIKVCQNNLLNCKSPVKTGNLIWKVRPIFNEQGYCSNMSQLKAEFIENGNGIYKIWEMPEEGWDDGYVLTADCSEGLEQMDWDSSTMLKRFGDKEMVVAELHAHLKPHEYAEELAKFGYLYFEPWIAIEKQGNSGGATINQILSFYRKLYHKEVMKKGYPELTDTVGFDMANRSIKQSVIGELSKCISLNLFTDYDEEFWRETLTYVNNNGVMEAQGKHRGQKCFDDRVMSRAIAVWINGNLPLPSRKVTKVELVGWRKENYARRNNNSLIGFTIR